MASSSCAKVVSTASGGVDDWIQEGTLAIEEGEEGWLVLGAEHQELARIAIGKGGNRHYYAVAWDGLYIGPVLRGTSALLYGGAYVAVGALSITGSLLCKTASLVYKPRPRIPPPDAPLADRFVEESVEVDGDLWYFRVWLPPDIEKVKRENGNSLPAFLLLHGFKECGWDNWWQTNSGLALHLQTSFWANWFPGIVVLPQLPRRPWNEQWWDHWRSPAMQRMALACLESAVAKYTVDRKRIYLLGESLGTEGAWFLAASKPGLFAGVGGCCGSVERYDWANWTWESVSDEEYDRLTVSIGRDVPFWFCHGLQDDFVPSEQSRRFYEALKRNRSNRWCAVQVAADVIYREYEDLHHHVWDHAYGEDDMIEWLLAQRRR
jgi:hypothetical protein